MKKSISTLINFLIPVFVFAQKSNSIPPLPSKPNLDYEIMKSVNDTRYLDAIAPIVAGGFLVLLVIALTKLILTNKLKNKIIDKGISEQLAISILERNSTNKKDESIKWGLILLAVGAGSIICYYTMPLHIHSIAIMAISIGASQLGNFFYLKNQNK